MRDYRINKTGLKLLREFEGLRLKPYRDAAGFPTIGIGHRILPTEHFDEITEDQAEALLRQDVRAAERVVSKYVTAPLNENQASALISFVYNVGPGCPGGKGGFAYLRNGQSSTLLRLLNERRFLAAAQEFEKWTRAGGPNPVLGLVRRRKAEKALFLAPVLVDSNHPV